MKVCLLALYAGRLLGLNMSFAVTALRFSARVGDGDVVVLASTWLMFCWDAMLCGDEI